MRAIKWVVIDFFGRDFDQSLEIDKEVIKLHFKHGTRKAYDLIHERFEDEERVYALIRWAFLTGIKRALRYPEEYKHLIYLLNALVKLEADEALITFLKAELEGNHKLIDELEVVRI